MEWLKGVCLFGASFVVAFCAVCVANAQEVSFVSNPLWLSTTRTTEGETVLASTVITKTTAEDVSGEVEFFANGKSIGKKEFSLPSNVGGAVVAVSFSPEKGTHLVSAKVTRATAGEESVTVAGEVKAKETLTIDPDNDRDQIADAVDADDDNDGVSDEEETTAGTDPLTKPAAPAVAGASTSDMVSQATETAKNLGAKLFEQTESLRNSASNYFDEKIAETEAQKKAKEDAADDFQDIEDRLTGDAKPLAEQVKDTSGLVERFKIQVYTIGAFVFGNMYAFYIISILFILWLLRKIWRRHSLD